jgi:hypothetical protein
MAPSCALTGVLVSQSSVYKSISLIFFLVSVVYFSNIVRSVRGKKGIDCRKLHNMVLRAIRPILYIFRTGEASNPCSHFHGKFCWNTPLHRVPHEDGRFVLNYASQRQRVRVLAGSSTIRLLFQCSCRGTCCLPCISW